MLIAAVVLCALLASLCQTAAGFGFALVFVPLLSLVLDVKETIAVSVILGPVAAIPTVVELGRDARWRVVSGLLAGSLIGAPLGAFLLVAASGAQLRVFVAAVIITSTLITLAGVAIRGPRRPLLVSLGVGALSGVLRSATSLGGPPVALYLLGLRYPPRAFVATNASYYLLGSVFSAATLALAGQLTMRVLLTAVAATPAVLAGVVGGGRGRASRNGPFACW